MRQLNELPITRIKLFLARILFYLIRPIYGTQKRVIKRHGIQYKIDITEGLDLSLFLFGSFQRHVTENKYINIPDDAIIFDIGANVGIMTLRFAKKALNGKVYAFEPTHYAFKKLNINLKLNSDLARRIKPVQSFVSSSEDRHDRIVAYSSWKINSELGNDKHPVHGGKAMSTEGVPTTTLDSFCEKEKITKLDLIKVDTDGYEFEVLSGAKNCIKKFRPQIIFELGKYVMDERGIDFNFYANFFKELNYRLSDSTNYKEITSSNYNKFIPTKGTIDILALPN